MKPITVVLVCALAASCGLGYEVTPLIAAAREGDAQRILELVKSGADVNERGGVNNWTPLMHAVHTNQPVAVKALIEAGADVNATAGARGHDTALRLAELQNHPNIAQFLREHGAKPSQ